MSVFQTLIESCPDALVVFGASGVLHYANPVASSLLSGQQKAVLEALSHLPIPTDQVVTIALKEDVGQEKFFECQIVEFDWEGSSAALGILRDVTEYRKVEEVKKEILEQKRVERIKDEFVSTVSHEIRTPLSIIRETTSQILDGIHGDINDAQKDFLSKSLRHIDRLTKIVNDLLNVSKIEAGKMEVHPEPVDLVALVRDVIAQFTPQIQKKGLQIHNSFSDSAIEVFVDKDKMTQVFINLLSNALKFTDTGCVGISLKSWENFIECSVKDTGRGVADEDLSRLFNKFEQIGRERGPGPKGTGLGLVISRGLIELHGGQIWAKSEEGKGTQMIFTIPKKIPSPPSQE